ncbi:MAG: hypothetical protein IJV08_11455 [Bacteroidaceae bacterium]|nr:hypothetical protein [Bacteroidaceae bacterium]MBR1449527.1 hypothetical protein [Prevotella sp.]
MNKELLFNLYAIHSPSGSEKRMRRFLKKQAAACGATSIEQDRLGNLFITKGTSDTYPCLAAHMDQVQRYHSKDFRVFEHDGVAFAFSARSMAQQGLGADDKNGIFICLECLRRYDVLKVAFFVGEETGCVGSRACDLSFFRDCRFIVQPDRHGGHDLITDMFCGDVCSEEFVQAIGADAFGYKHDSGSITDVGELTERGVGISCLNLSCGYYKAHSDQEVTVLPELENCLNFVCHIIETCTAVYPFQGGRRTYSFGGFGHSKGWYEDDETYYYECGYYDEDIETMRQYLGIQPDVSLDEIRRSCISEFHAFCFFDSKECDAMLSDIYTFVKDECTGAHWWDDDDLVGDTVGQLVEDTRSLRKVS